MKDWRHPLNMGGASYFFQIVVPNLVYTKKFKIELETRMLPISPQ